MLALYAGLYAADNLGSPFQGLFYVGGGLVVISDLTSRPQTKRSLPVYLRIVRTHTST